MPCSLDDGRFAVQAFCSGLVWVDHKYTATREEADEVLAALLANDAAWMPASKDPASRKTRVVPIAECGVLTRRRASR